MYFETRSTACQLFAVIDLPWNIFTLAITLYSQSQSHSIILLQHMTSLLYIWWRTFANINKVCSIKYACSVCSMNAMQRHAGIVMWHISGVASPPFTTLFPWPHGKCPSDARFRISEKALDLDILCNSHTM